MSEWWREAVFYQIYPRSFADSDGDGVGDLAGIAARLDHVASLGVDAVWLSPFFASPMADFGYDVSDYRAVDPVFGTMDDFRAVLEKAHALGLKLIIDQVYSHTSDQHAWFAASRRDRTNDHADWYVWADPAPDGGPPNNWLSVFGGPAWTWDARRHQYYLHNFLSTQPDLNFHCEAVQEAILDTARFWLDAGVDGFRLDVANFYFHDAQLRDNPSAPPRDEGRPHTYQRHLYDRSRPETLDFLARLRAVTDGYGGKMMVAEVDSADPTGRSIEYTDGPTRLHTAYSFGFLHTDTLTPDLVRTLLEGWRGREAWPSWSFSNHDVARVASRFGGEGRPGRARMLLALVLSLRGTPFLYQGEELGLPQADVPFERLRDPEAIRFYPEGLGRDGCRTPMPWSHQAPHGGFSGAEPWLPVDPRHEALAVDRQEGDEGSTLSAARALLAFRREHAALRTGGMDFWEAGPTVCAFTREGDGQRIACLFNLGAEDAVVADERLAGGQDVTPTPMGGALEGAAARLGPDGALFVRLA